MNRIRILSRRGWILALTIICSTASAATAADNNVAVLKILTGLKNPRGVAVRPDGSGDTYEIFIAESGAGRIVRVASGKPEKAADVVSGFSTKSASGEDLLAPGVQSFYFLDHSRLVATGGDDDGKPFVRLYELPEPMTPIAADQAKADVDLPESDKELQNEVRTFRGITRS